MNVTFTYPWLLAAVVLPLLVRWLAPPHREPRQALAVPFLRRLASVSGRTPTEGSVVLAGGWPRIVATTLLWICIVLALARPQIIEKPVMKEVPVRDLLLAVDLSGSMEAEDFKNAGETTTRLAAVKEVLGEFLEHRKGDRVGLIFFGSAPFVQAPFTEDIGVCQQLLDEAQVRMAGPQTAFGDALGLAINTFERSTVKDRVLIALTDGNDTASKVPPAKAAEIARDKKILIHTVSVGDPTAAGEQALDEKSLGDVAAATGGIHAHAENRDELADVYRRIDELETRKAETVTHRPRRDVYWWPLAAGWIIAISQQILQLAAARIRSARAIARPGSPAAAHERRAA